MSRIPAFDIGIWNAWIFMVLLFLSFIPTLMMKKEAQIKYNEGWASKRWPKAARISALLTHIVILPLAIIYSIFLPLKLDTAWFYVGLPICLIALLFYYGAMINVSMARLVNEPITQGVYRFSRHPIYLGSFLLFFGIGIACASWVFILFALAWIILWLIAVPAEEKDVSEKYGDTYREYMNRTPRWLGIPKSR
jgi:protein-S-isoprenylcysteine O-methyltransferase Ste14